MTRLGDDRAQERGVRWLRLGLGLMIMGVGAGTTTLFCLLALPFRSVRIRACNHFGQITGPILMRLTGCPLTVTGTTHLDATRPAIYVSNHTSIIDIFVAIWLSPVGTVGIAKKQVIFYPFLGQLYLLSGHLRIDRADHESAVASLAALAQYVTDQDLSIFLWPEGTRSRSGQLLPFKKGLVHLAISTGLPVVPIVTSGAHRAWAKGSLALNRVPLSIDVLPPIDTGDWTLDRIDDHLDEVHAAYRRVLPADQQPAATSAAA